MERLFQTHYIRKQICLDGVWEFQRIENLCLPGQYEDTMSVPSCWEMTIKHCRYRGLAAYKRRVRVSGRKNLRLVFKAVSHSGTIYWDGRQVGFHYNAYTPFEVILPGVEEGEHTLEVIVDNRFTEESRLHIPNDYYTYGGITRSVFMEELDDCYIQRIKWETSRREEIAGGGWEARVRVALDNLSSREQERELELLCGLQSKRVKVALKAGEKAEFSCGMVFAEAKAWSMEQPRLYSLEARLLWQGQEMDDICDRVGFRTVQAVDGRIEINGSPIFLKGVNRHEDHGNCGCSIPLQLMDADIKLMRDMGINAVRTSHYPNDELFLDLCDENGILVWEESHDRGGDTERITYPLFQEQSMKVMEEMLEYHYNHPSIIIWGCLNEAASDTEAGAEVYRRHLEFLKKDPGRLCTYASNKSTTDLCLGMEDICSFNMYPYWYGDSTIEEDLEKVYVRLEETGNSHKPILVSEYGGGGIYNFHDVMRVKWSEEYQADLLERATGELLAQKRLAGIFIWQFCDVRISQEGPRNWPMTRPMSRNNKGLVDEYRRPKQAYGIVKKLFRAQKGGKDI